MILISLLIKSSVVAFSDETQVFICRKTFLIIERTVSVRREPSPETSIPPSTWLDSTLFTPRGSRSSDVQSSQPPLSSAGWGWEGLAPICRSGSSVFPTAPLTLGQTTPEEGCSGASEMTVTRGWTAPTCPARPGCGVSGKQRGPRLEQLTFRRLSYRLTTTRGLQPNEEIMRGQAKKQR